MTWLLYKIVSYFTFSKLLYLSFKCSCDNSQHLKYNTTDFQDILISWLLYASLIGYDNYLAFLDKWIRWLPGFYYLKSLVVIIFISYPQLRLGRLVLLNAFLPALNRIDAHLSKFNIKSASDVIEVLLFLLLILIFPSVNDPADDASSNLLCGDQGLTHNVNECVKNEMPCDLLVIDETADLDKMFKMQLSITTRKLSILTEHLHELQSTNNESRLSHEDTRQDDSHACQNGDNCTNSCIANETIQLPSFHVVHNLKLSHAGVGKMISPQSASSKSDGNVRNISGVDKVLDVDQINVLDCRTVSDNSPRTPTRVDHQENTHKSLEVLQTVLQRVANESATREISKLRQTYASTKKSTNTKYLNGKLSSVGNRSISRSNSRSSRSNSKSRGFKAEIVNETSANSQKSIEIFESAKYVTSLFKSDVHRLDKSSSVSTRGRSISRKSSETFNVDNENSTSFVRPASKRIDLNSVNNKSNKLRSNDEDIDLSKILIDSENRDPSLRYRSKRITKVISRDNF